MRAALELPAFATLAVCAHLALFAAWPGGAPEGAGNGGDAVLSLDGASGAVEAMVASWEAPPEAAAVMPGLDAPDGAEARPETPAPDAAPYTPDAAAALSPASREATPPRVAPPKRPALPTPEISEGPRAPSAPMTDGAPAPVPGQADAPPSDRPAPIATPEAAATPTMETASVPPVPVTRPKVRPEQAAQGKGENGTRGSRAETTAPSLSESARRSLVASWGAEIRARVEARKVHPEGLRAAGRPVVRITVARSGALEGVDIVQSSRVAALDEAAVRAVRRAGRFPEAPGNLDLARVSFDLPISFTR